MAAGSVPPEWRLNTPTSTGRAGAWATLWKARELVWILAQRDLRVRYKQATLGVLWVLVQPIASVLIFTLVFRRLANVPSQGVPYPLFALVGMAVWLYFSSSVSRGSEVLVDNPNLVTKVAFPRLAAPASSVLSPLADLAVTLVLIVVLLVAYRVPPTWRLVAVPVWLALLVAAGFGVVLWLSALNVKYRDIRHAVGPVLQIALFASPVVYPAPKGASWPELVYGVNPMTGVIALARWSVLGTPWPGWPLAVSATSTVVILLTGMRYFRRSEREFADVI